MPDNNTFLPRHGHYKNLRVYRVAEALYDLTYFFSKKFLPLYGDRTVDQMVQAARSGKQNIAEGNQAAETSAETEIKLTGVAKASLEEVLADFEDYLRTRSLPQWKKEHPRAKRMRDWTRSNSFWEQYAEMAEKMSDEELANLCITLCHQAIYMLQRLMETQQKRFVSEGGIKERMHAARTAYRQAEMKELQQLREENEQLKAEIEHLKTLLEEHRKSE